MLDFWLSALRRIHSLVLLSEKLVNERVLLEFVVAITSVLVPLLRLLLASFAAARTRKSIVTFIICVYLLSQVSCNEV